jgi:hypothetical protein
MSTPIQNAVVDALEKLALESEGSGMPGAPVKLKVTEHTVNHIKRLVGKTFVVDSQGETTEEFGS